MLSEAINKVIWVPNHEEDDYFVLMDEEVQTNKLEKKLYKEDKEVFKATGKDIQNLSFNSRALLPS